MAGKFSITTFNPIALGVFILCLALVGWGPTENFRLLGLAGIIYLSK